ncbi:hypothetical protein BN134_3273 [Cronobacter dublinensis 1210]|uniref:Uncharacterized protein n=1 Tax=Cronobacter dublinensis 1210 TaxID=1208656 RepID=A0ABM9QAD3_9ENTR|nr:hypothetical protein BN134_3273 [Cronobacter dublinensis 1210]CCJ84585.1 hypothetical protein BN133_962 [Cronobacter dublinensis 582]
MCPCPVRGVMVPHRITRAENRGAICLPAAAFVAKPAQK